jgi:hypothetical protein
VPEWRQGRERNAWGGCDAHGHGRAGTADDHGVWMLWILAAWLVVATLTGVLLGRGIRLADRRSGEAVLTTADLPNFVAAT